MKAAVIRELGQAPEPADIPRPEPGPGEVLVQMAAAPLNPIDVGVATGRFYGGHPPLPYVPGVEAVGTVVSGPRAGALVYAFSAGLGVSRSGAGAEFFIANEALLIELPAGADPVLSAALGVAGMAGWMPLTWRAPVQAGETVLVLGATGAAGTIAVQAARHRGAGRVVAAGRNRERLAALDGLADATVILDGPDLAGRLAAACAPGADVVYDPLWGPPLEAALQALKPGARIVQLGESAGPTANLPSAAVRGKQLSILGFSNFAVPRAPFVEGYLAMVKLAMAGKLRMDVTPVPLAGVGRAWAGQLSGEGKFVLVP